MTAVTLAMTPVGENITLLNTVGGTYNFKPSNVFITLGVGWAAFLLAQIFNLVYYVLHPSEVSHPFNLKNIQKKLVVAVVGYEINLVNCTVTG